MTGNVYGEEVLKAVINPYTGKQDFIHNLSSLTVGDLNGSVQILDENTLLGGASFFNFTGANVSVSIVGGTATITISGGSGGDNLGNQISTAVIQAIFGINASSGIFTSSLNVMDVITSSSGFIVASGTMPWLNVSNAAYFGPVNFVKDIRWGFSGLASGNNAIHRDSVAEFATGTNQSVIVIGFVSGNTGAGMIKTVGSGPRKLHFSAGVDNPGIGSMTIDTNGKIGVANSTPTSLLDVFNGSVTSRGTNAGFSLNGRSIFFSTWNACGGYNMASSSGDIASNATIQLTPSQFGGTLFCGTPAVTEIEGVNTAGLSVRLKDTLSTTLIEVYNSDIINAKKFSLTNVWVQ